MAAAVLGSEDHRLVLAFRSGEDGAFEAIVRRHYGSLLERADRRMGGGALAEDAVQAALVRAHRYLRTASVENLGAWLRRIVDNCANDLLRLRRKELTLEQAAVPAVADHPARRLEAQELENLVRDGIQRLPETYREPLFLHVLMGLEAKEVAARLQDNIHSVKSRASCGAGWRGC